MGRQPELLSTVRWNPRLRAHEWRWPRAGKIKFSHLQFDTSVYDWQGAQITLICFDELTHFTAHQFFYIVGRNRSTCGVRPCIRATCNPDADRCHRKANRDVLSVRVTAWQRQLLMRPAPPATAPNGRAEDFSRQVMAWL
jgi:hypothetical protein